MLNRLTVRNFKSLRDVTVELPQLAVLFGPNAVGKSNLLDAIQALRWMGFARTLSDALDGQIPVRGYPFEAFSVPPGGVPEMLRKGTAKFTLEADLTVKTEKTECYRYRVEPEIHFGSGQLSIGDEYLARLTRASTPKGTAAIERVNSHFVVRRKGKGRRARPRKEPVGQNHTLLSDRSLSGADYNWLEDVRGELYSWNSYYFEPRLAMRIERAPADVFDIGIHAEDIVPFLFKLQAAEPKHFDGILRALRLIVPSVESLIIDLNQQNGMLNLMIRQAGVAYSSRVLSEGTLRVLALCSIVANPWGGSLVSLEEPENGVHPRQLELIARLLFSLSERCQVVVATHSPLFVDMVLKLKRESDRQAKKKSDRADIGLFNVRLTSDGTVIEPFETSGPLLEDIEIARALASATDEAIFSNLVRRGFIDE